MLEKYNKIWDKVSNTIQKWFDSEPIYNEKYLKRNQSKINKIKSWEGKINTNFHDNKIQRKRSQCTCLSVILIHTVFKMVKNFYPQVYLKECKYILKEKRHLDILLLILIKKILVEKILKR